MTPYPAVRRYTWAVPEQTFSYTEALELLESHRRSMPETQNIPRWQAYSLTIDAINELQHRGVDKFPGHKIHRLLIRAAESTGWWYKEQRYKFVSENSDPGIRFCGSCAQNKPIECFRRVATDAERQRNRWHNEGKIRYTLTVYCQDCRNAQAKEKAAKRKRIEANREARELEKLNARKRKLTIQEVKRKNGLTYRVIASQIKRQIADMREAYKNAGRSLYVARFYLEKLRCLDLAAKEVERRVDEGIPLVETPIDAPLPYWTAFLQPEDMKQLTHAHEEVLARPTRGRTPAI